VHEARATDPVPRHAAVVDAVRRRDPEAAEAAMRVLLAEAAEDVAGVVSDDRASTEEER